MKHVSFFRHALALDERRVKFLPEYAYEGSSLPDNKDEQDIKLSDRFQSDDPPHTKEVWFAGTHSDMLVFSVFLLCYFEIDLTATMYSAEEETSPIQIWTEVSLLYDGCHMKPPLQVFTWPLSRASGM